jgi:hypothetical protein
MPDFKCVVCRTRTRRAGDAADFTGDPCPSCGAPQELVYELSEVIGFRSVMTADRPLDDPAPLADFAARRNALYAQRVRDAIDSERWGDDGGSAVVAVALPTSDARLRPNAGAFGENGAT